MADRWVSSTSDESLPSDAVLAGVDSDGAAIYAGRAEHNGGQLPAKIIPSKKISYVSYDGKEHMKKTYDILCGKNYHWVKPSDGQTIPEHAMAIGRSDGEILYLGRGSHDGGFTPGKVQISHGCLYIPYDGKEISLTDYEVLVRKV